LKGHGTAAALAKASLVAALVFSLAWVRLPLSPGDVASIAGIFLLYAVLLLIASLVVGIPLVLFAERFKVESRFSSTLGATLVGTLVPLLIVPSPNSSGASNPFALVFSPWTRPRPGFIDEPPIVLADYVGSAVFGALIGGVLGAAFWYFRTRGARPNKALERTGHG
jgi:hypothetical protein